MKISEEMKKCYSDVERFGAYGSHGEDHDGRNYEDFNLRRRRLKMTKLEGRG